MKLPDFLHVDTNLHKLKLDQKIFGWAPPKIGVAKLVTGLWNWMNLKNELMERTDLLHTGGNSGKLKFNSGIFGCVWSKLAMPV